MIKTKEDYNKTINILKNIVRSWNKADVYLVGGCVRDELLGLVPKDIDLVIDCPNGSEDFIEYLKKTYKDDVCNSYATFPKFGTARFSLCIEPDKSVSIECVIPRAEKYEGTTRKPSSIEFGSLTEDSLRRDFCCNALYKNILDSKVIDPTGHGLEDLNNMILRTPLDPEQTFLDDPLRMLRAIRFACAKKFTISNEVYDKIKPYPGFYTLSWERIQEEFNKILLSSKAVEGIRMLQDRGLLSHIFPDLSSSWGMDQKSKYHSLDLTEHTLKVLSGVMVSKYHDNLFPRKHELELRLAALLHDIGKIKTKIIKSDGSCSYYEHEKVSAEMAEDALRRLKYSNDTIDLVKKIIYNHMCIKGNYSYTTHEYTGSPQQTRRIVKRLGNNLALVMDLIEADNLAHAPEYCMPGQVQSFWEHYKKDVILFKGLKSKNEHPVNGDVIMSRLGISGKAVGDTIRIFDLWFTDNPKLTEEDLIKQYISWTEGIEIWIALTDSGSYKISYNEPIIEENIINIPFSSTYIEYDVKMFKENIKLNPGEKVKVSAHNYPGLHLSLQNKKKANQILNEIGENLKNLIKIQDFEKLELTYDCQNDLSTNIKWADGRIDYFI